MTKLNIDGILIPGAFMPLQAGQLALIRAAFAMDHRVTIALQDRGDDPIPAGIRAAWLRDLFPDVKIIFVDNETGARDLDDWLTTLKDWRAGRLLCSEPWGPDLAKSLKADWTVMDPERVTFPIHSKDLRADLVSHWAQLPGVARPYFQKRLTLVGPESVGKSQISKHLAEKFGGPHVPEYGRPFEKYRDEGDYSGQELFAIVDGHEAWRGAIAHHAGPVLFEDTDALMTAVWAEMLLGRRLRRLEKILLRADHYILLGDDVPWVDDGIRYYGREEKRREFFNATRAMLDRLGASYDIVTGDWETREARAEDIARTMIEEVRHAI
ncbi:AAA family ATPase [Paracoccaceae bacterium GXU_MW_L88]